MPGIGQVREKHITGARAEQKVVREIMLFLHRHGVGRARAVRDFRVYGADVVQVMTENPYRLACDIHGMGFRAADAINMNLGIERTVMVRIRAGVGHALTEATGEGQSGLPGDELKPLASGLLKVPDDLIRTALDLELAEGTVGDTICVFLDDLHAAEQTSADRILKIAFGELPWSDIDVEKALP